MKIIVTGSGGLIGSEACRYFAKQGHQVFGFDNNMRKYFFGEEGSVAWNLTQIKSDLGSLYQHHEVDIRDSGKIEENFKTIKPDAIIHTAAQPSHDWAAREPLTDFSVNATGTLILLEAARKYSPEAPFIYTSTNKVYGDKPNQLPLIELETRYELGEDHPFFSGIDESMSIDSCTHSLFGVSKASADLLVQEYGRYFKMPTVSFRGGCLTGPAHSGVELHGFLSYLAKCIIEGRDYTIYGYKGKQVRDNISSHDLIRAFDVFISAPRAGEIYNIGGARANSVSMLEAIKGIEEISGKKAKVKFVEANRIGDHMWYISSIKKFRQDYPGFQLEQGIQKVLVDICQAWMKRR